MLNTFSVFNFAKKYKVFLFSLHSPHHLPSLSLQLFWLQLSFTNTGHWGCTIIVKMLLIQSHPLFPPCVSRHIVELNFPSVALHHLCYLYHSLIKLSLFSVLMVRSQITAENLYMTLVFQILNSIPFLWSQFSRSSNPATVILWSSFALVMPPQFKPPAKFIWALNIEPLHKHKWKDCRRYILIVSPEEV